MKQKMELSAAPTRHRTNSTVCLTLLILYPGSCNGDEEIGWIAGTWSYIIHTYNAQWTDSSELHDHDEDGVMQVNMYV